jgi:YVTN family beta-propeller protein
VPNGISGFICIDIQLFVILECFYQESGVTGERAEKVSYLKKYSLILMLLAILLPSCQTMPLYQKAPLGDESVVFLYIKPFPQDASRLSFSPESIQAVSEDGKSYNLILSLTDFSSKEMDRQRLVASGSLPPGSYTGFTFKVKRARLQTAEGDASLHIPEVSVRLPYPFRLQGKKAIVISMAFQYRESMQNNVIFNPAFLFEMPHRPLTTLMGFVSNSDTNTVMIFDKQSQEVTGAVVTGSEPRGMALSQGRGRVFVAVSGEDAIAVIDIASAEVLADIRLSTGDKPNEPALTPDERTLFVPNAGSDTVSVIDSASFIEIERIKVGNEPRSVTIDKAGRRAFICNTGSSTLSVIDINSKTVVASVVVEPRPLRSQFNKNGDRLYVISEASPYLLVMDPATLSVVRREVVGMGMHSLKVDVMTDLFYIGKRFDVELAVYDPFTWVPMDYVRTKGPVEYGAIDGETNNLYMAIPSKKAVSVTNLTSKKMLKDFDVGGSPYWVTLHGER